MGQIPESGSNPEFDITATMSLYEGNTLFMLYTTLLIVNCCKTHGVSNTFMNELLMLLSMSILPLENCLSKSEYEAFKILRRLGLAYNMIHACPNGCCLFKGDLEDAENFLVCEHNRYRMCGRSRVPTLILRHFLIILQLQRMFSSTGKFSNCPKCAGQREKHETAEGGLGTRRVGPHFSRDRAVRGENPAEALPLWEVAA